MRENCGAPRLYLWVRVYVCGVQAFSVPPLYVQLFHKTTHLADLIVATSGTPPDGEATACIDSSPSCRSNLATHLLSKSLLAVLLLGSSPLWYPDSTGGRQICKLTSAGIIAKYYYFVIGVSVLVSASFPLAIGSRMIEFKLWWGIFIFCTEMKAVEMERFSLNCPYY